MSKHKNFFGGSGSGDRPIGSEELLKAKSDLRDAEEKLKRTKKKGGSKKKIKKLRRNIKKMYKDIDHTIMWQLSYQHKSAQPDWLEAAKVIAPPATALLAEIIRATRPGKRIVYPQLPKGSRPSGTNYMPTDGYTVD